MFGKPSNPEGTDAVMSENMSSGELENGEHIAQTGQTLTIDPEIEKRVIKKIDRRLVPLVMVMYLLAFLDRSNIGNAKIAGMSTDLKLVGNKYQWLLNIFYISYILFQWQALCWKVIPPHIWAAFCALGWGLVSAVQGGVHSWAGEMVLRFLMGVFEAGYGPGIPYLLSFFYLRSEVGFRQGIFLSAAPLATTFAGALAYGITAGHAALADWRLLFLVEGLPTLAMVPVVFFLLPDSPAKLKSLTAEERVVAEARAVRQAGKVERIGGVSFREALATFADAKAWFTALMYFSVNVSFASLPVFLPTILSEMGFTAISAQGLTAPPFFLSFLMTVLSSYIADRTQQRGIVLICLSALGGIGYILLATCKSVAGRYTGVFLAAMGVFPSIATILPWTTNNQGSDTRRGAGIIILNTIGQCGPVLGTNLFPTAEGPYYVKGQSICAAFMFFTTFLALSLRTLLAYENKKLDRQYGTLQEQKARMAAAAGTNEEKSAGAGEENYGPLFRYCL